MKFIKKNKFLVFFNDFRVLFKQKMKFLSFFNSFSKKGIKYKSLKNMCNLKKDKKIEEILYSIYNNKFISSSFWTM